MNSADSTDGDREATHFDAIASTILASEMCPKASAGRWGRLLESVGVRPRAITAQRPALTSPLTAAGRERKASSFLAPPWVWALVPFAGWLILFGLWVAFDWATTPGLFDYRSATLGYALLLPLAWWAASQALSSLPRSGGRGIEFLAAVVGAILAMVVQAAWLLDPSPSPNWSFPEAHEFNAAGWYNAAYLTAVSAGSSLLGVGLARRMVAARREDLARLAASGWLELVAFATFGLIALAGFDNADVTETEAGSSSLIGLVLASAAAVSVLSWGRTCRRERLAAAARGLAGGAGLAALTAHGIPGVGQVEGIASVGLVGVLSVGLLAPRTNRGRTKLGALALITVSLGLGTVGLGLHLVADDGLAAAAVLIVGATVIALVTGFGTQSASDRLLGGTAVAFTLGLIVLAGWLNLPGRSETDANYALGFATFFLDGLVIGLIRDRFGDVVRVDRHWYSGQKPTSDHEAVGAQVTVQVLCIGIAAITALTLLYVAAGSVLGVDQGTGETPLSTSVLLPAFAGAVVLLVAAIVVAQRDGRTYRPPEMAVSPPAAILAAVGLGIWIAALFSQLENPRVPLFAAAGAALLALMTGEDFLRTPARLHLQRPGQWGRLVAAMAAAAVFASCFLLLTTGLWDGSIPAASGDAALAAFGFLLATATLVTLSAAPIALALRIRRLTPESAWQNVALIQVLYATLALIGLVLPVFVVGRIEIHDPANVGLATISALAPVPALLGALIWVLHTNSNHLREQRPSQIPVVISEQIEDHELALELNHWRLAWLATHTNFQNRAATAVVAGGGAWMVMEIALR